MRRVLFSGFFLSLDLMAFSQVVPLAREQEDSVFIRRISDEIFTNGKAYENLRHLTKKIGARLTGSAQMVKAEKWGLNILHESGADRAWLQQCVVPHWIRGGKDEAVVYFNAAPKGARNTKSSAKMVNILALGNSLGTGAKGISANLVLVNSFDDLEAKKDEVKGKIVFYNYKFNPTFISPFEAYGDAVRYRGQGASRAARYGAVAVIVRSMSHSTDNHPHTGALRYDSAYKKIPAVAIGLKDADWLSEELRKGKVSTRIRTMGKFLPDTIGHNVIGELTGSEFPDQYITVGGHLDSWDPAEGAHDDGAGIVQTIEILRAFKSLGYKPRHTIRFVLFANEENGLRGGNKYAAEAKAKNEKHIFALESDAGGFTPRGFGFNATDEQIAKVQKWSSLLAPYGAGNLIKGGDGADIGPLQRAYNIPAAGLDPDPQRYFDYHHAANDVFENVNKRELELGAISMAALIYLVDKYGL
ncbi:MAG: M20/M25/M40 family metallo-hydrolase [Chitinophagales bacterium]